MKGNLLKFIDKHESDGVYTPLERYAISVIKKNIEEDRFSTEDKILITDDFLANYLEFDETSGSPIGETKFIESLIDFVLYSDKQ